MMTTDSERVSSPGPQIRATPGAFPSIPSSDAQNVVSAHHSLSQAVHARRHEFTRSKTVRVKVGSWNVASLSGTEKDIGAWFVDGKGVSESLSGVAAQVNNDPSNAIHEAQSHIESVTAQEARRSKKLSTIPKNDPGPIPGGDEIGIYVLGLQEIVDINSATEALRPYNDPHPSRKWKRAVEEALPPGYQRIADQQLIGLLLLIYASPSIAPTVSSVSTTSVGTGVMGYMGNKGAVTTRIVLGETTRLVFINCHMAAGSEKGSVERRNWDASQITSRTKFEPIYDGGGVMEEFGEGLGDEDFAFWFGDLNYRIDSLPGEDVRRLLMLHTRNEYDARVASERKIDDELSIPFNATAIKERDHSERSSEDSHVSTNPALKYPPQGSSTTLPVDPSSDPASLQTTLSSLLPHDQLQMQMRSRKAFYDGWREGPIEFLPTYKYDVGSVGMFDSSEKKRGPSWCDRILFRTRKDRSEYERKAKEEQEAMRRDEEMKTRGIEVDDDVLFDYDPDTDGAEEDCHENDNSDAEIVVTKSGFEDKLHLDYYTSHQRVLSSDHKPLDAVFTLTYDAVDPELKAKVHQEVARELDKAENEGRPCVTVVIDHHHHDNVDIDITDHEVASVEGVDFGHVRYEQTKKRHLTVANTGRVPATFGFVGSPFHSTELGSVTPPWLRIEFDRQYDKGGNIPGTSPEHTLEPGDALNVELILCISDVEEVRKLNDNQSTIDYVLVLHIQNGRDHFIPVRGRWLRSSLGRSIDKLIRIPEGGVRRLQHQKPDGSGSHGQGSSPGMADDQGVKWSAPRELFRLTEAIEKLVERAMAEWDMRDDGFGKVERPWNIDGWPFVPESWTQKGDNRNNLVLEVREALDTDQPFEKLVRLEASSLDRLEAFSEVLIGFLASLEDGVIVEALWLELEKSIDTREKTKRPPLSGEEERARVLEVLSASPPHSVSFTFVTMMLARIANEVAPAIPTVIEGACSALDPESGKAQIRARGKSLSEETTTARRQRVNRKLAAVFADIIIRAPISLKEKERKVTEGRKQHVIEVFLEADGQ